MPLFLHDLIDLVHIAHPPPKVHRDDHLRPLCYRPGQPIHVHLIGTLCRIDQHQLCPHMAGHAGRGGIGVGCGDHFIPRPHA